MYFSISQDLKETDWMIGEPLTVKMQLILRKNPKNPYYFEHVFYFRQQKISSQLEDWTAQVWKDFSWYLNEVTPAKGYTLISDNLINLSSRFNDIKF